jgi:uncharacterized membrane protein
MAAQNAGYVTGGRAVAAGRGWSWIASAWAMFKRQPGAWIGVIVILLVIYVALGFLHVVGFLASLLLGPVFGGGILLGCRAADEGRALEVGHLFAGFRERFGQLVLVGALNLVATTAIVLAVALVTGVSLALTAGQVASMPPAALLSVALAILIIAALQLPVMMAVWFAPALVALQGKEAIPAMRESFVGCLRNVVPFLVYGLVLLGLSLPASLLAGLGWLVLLPVMAASVYTSWKDIFTAP